MPTNGMTIGEWLRQAHEELLEELPDQLAFHIGEMASGIESADRFTEWEIPEEVKEAAQVLEAWALQLRAGREEK
jgi:hypothetical protein